MLRPGQLTLVIDMLFLVSRAVALESMHWAGDGTSLRKARLLETIQFMQTHHREPLTTEQLARRASVSPRQFSRVFQAETGTNIVRFVREVRIHKAIGVMGDDKLNIQQVVEGRGSSRATTLTAFSASMRACAHARFEHC